MQTETSFSTAPAPGLVLFREMDRPSLRDALRHHELTRLTRGGYTSPSIDGEDPAESRRRRALVHLRAVDDALTAPHHFCRESAALVWGIPLWRTPSRAHVIQRTEPGGRGRRDVVRHRDKLGPEETSSRHGLAVTSLTRTVVDCARTLPAVDGLVIADAALRLGACREQLSESCRAGRRGVIRARAIMTFADDGAQSPGESATRLLLLRHGLPQPETQIRVDTRRGMFFGDLGWRRWRVLVEFDGYVKYSRLADGDPARVVFREKLRQEAIEEAGWRVVRVTGSELRDGTTLAARICRLLPGVELRPRPELR